MPLDTGSYFGPYQIISVLGKGGMGEVYRAKDTRLERQVAIKVLSEQLTGNEKALTRFEQEAKTLAALSHPNIVAIYDIGTDHGVSFVAMELLEGETLRDCLARSPLPWRRVLEIGSVVADSLSAAHSKGVIHRDLKPENIFLTSAGVVKILDFGLARIDRVVSTEELTVAPTGAVATESGIIMGTVQYMSPEQARGQVVDHRTDIWAFGCVLYEMLTRRRAFQGNTFSDTIANLLLKEPEWQELPQDVPQKVREILRRCLQKDPSRRVQDVTTLKIEIDKVLSGLTVSRPHPKPRAARKRIRSLVVLPLTNLSSDPEKEYFADGMTEALISGLAKLGALRIISRTSAMCYKGTTKSLPEIAQELNVDAVMEGSVLSVGQRVRITVQLISAATDTHLWAETYDRDLQDVMLLQSEVAQAVAQKIQVTLTAEDTKRLSGARPVNPEAYDACLKGRFHLYKFSPEHLESALGYFQLALEKDPKCAAAYAGIGDIWLQRTMRGYLSPTQTISKAKDALLLALEMDDSLAEVHVSLALFKFGFEWDWNAAEKEYQKAIQLNCNSGYAHFFYSDFLMCMGRVQEAAEEMNRALDLDPLNSFFQCIWGWHLVFLRRFDEAIAQMSKILIAEPNFSSAYLGLWGAFHQKRMYEEALEHAKKFFAVIGDSEVAEAMASGYAEGGYPEAMRQAAQKLTERSIQAHIPAIRIARLYAHAGAKDQALQWLEKAFEQRELPMIHLKPGWDWDNLRDHPRFQNLLHRMKL